MCGIAGFFSMTSLDSSSLNVIRDMNLLTMKHRGPDDAGTWIDRSCKLLLSHVRLSILDLSSNGGQPMHSKSGNLTIVYNGEIYNHRDIRKRLLEDHCLVEWSSESDTETLIEAIEFWGIERALKMCVGMFALAVWDKRYEQLYLARDRFGEKPLYWGWQDDKFYFASELSTIAGNPYFKSRIDRDSLNQLVRYNYIPAPHSIYKNINKLRPGHYITIDANKGEIKQDSVPYWDFESIVNKSWKCYHESSYIETLNSLDDKLTEVIAGQMLSDVPIGAFLSGGIDSSAIVSIMHKVSDHPVNTFSLGFVDENFNEAISAKQIAKHIGTNHTELYISEKELMNYVPRLADVYSEPFADSSQIPTFLLSEMVAKHVKVSLSGDAGDELFGGYNQYMFAPKIWRYISAVPFSMRKFAHSILLEKNLSNRMERLNHLLPAEDRIDMYKRLVTHWGNANDLVLDSKESQNKFNDFMSLKGKYSYEENLMAFDTLTYLTDDILVKVDRASMFNGLETRVPFLNHELFELVWNLPLKFRINGDSNKWILKELLARYVPKKLVDRPKKGFAVPLAQWLRGPLRDWAEDLLSFERLSTENYFNASIVRSAWESHLSGRRDHSLKLWSILMFQLWLEKNKGLILE